MGSNPVQGQLFWGLLLQLLKLKAHCEDHKFHSCLSAFHIYDFHIFIFNRPFHGIKCIMGNQGNMVENTKVCMEINSQKDHVYLSVYM